MEHATSNANDADGHCRLPRKYTVARAARSGGLQKNRGTLPQEGRVGGGEEVRRT